MITGSGSALVISGFVSTVLGTFEEADVFSDGPSSSLGGNGLLRIGPDGSIRVDIPAQFRNVGCILELQLNYVDGGEAHYLLEDDTGATISEGDLDSDATDAHQTFTLLVDLSPFVGTAFVTLTNTSDTWELLFNPYLQLYKLETLNSNGIFVADLRGRSSRVDAPNTDALADEWFDVVYSPADFWQEGEVQFNIADIIGPMTQPIIEFNFAREEDDDCDFYLHDSLGTQVAYWYADYCEDESMGQTLIVDLTMYKASPFFTTDQDDATFVSPFVKIYDAAVRSAAGLTLDVSPAGREFVSSSGKFSFYQDSDDYPDGGCTTTMSAATPPTGSPIPRASSPSARRGSSPSPSRPWSEAGATRSLRSATGHRTANPSSRSWRWWSNWRDRR